MGYHRSGFNVVGVDVKFQPRYPFEFHKSDWREYFLANWQSFDAFHASPPCQGYSAARHIKGGSSAPKLIADVRDLLRSTGKPYIIENVMGAKFDMINPVRLRGNMFGLKVIRDRLFETNPWLMSPPLLPVVGTTNSYRGRSNFSNAEYISVAGHMFDFNDAKIAMGINWMNKTEIAQSIPPAYTEWIGCQILTLFPIDNNSGKR